MKLSTVNEQGGDGEVKRRSRPDHARLAATVLAALAHEPYAAVFWRACEKAARREPPGAERRPEACRSTPLFPISVDSASNYQYS